MNTGGVHINSNLTQFVAMKNIFFVLNSLIMANIYFLLKMKCLNDFFKGFIKLSKKDVHLLQL